MVIRDKQTGQEYEGADGTAFDTTKYEVVAAEAPGPERPPPEDIKGLQALERHVDKATQPQEPFSLKRMGANLLRVGAPMAAGAATGGLGFLGQLASAATAGGASEYAAEKIEGEKPDPLRIGLASLFGGAARPARAVAEGVRGGGKRIGEALKSGGNEPVDPTLMTDALADVTRRVGTNPPAASTRRVLDNVAERVTQPGQMTLRDVEDIRRNVGSAGRTFRSPATKQASDQFYAASKGTMEQAEQAGSKAAGDVLEGVGAEAARKSLFAPISSKELWTLLGGGGIATGSPEAGIPLALIPLLLRLYNATKGVRPHPAFDAGVGGVANVGANELRRE